MSYFSPTDNMIEIELRRKVIALESGMPEFCFKWADKTGQNP
jgi:hypothetical protein